MIAANIAARKSAETVAELAIDELAKLKREHGK